MIYKYVKLRIDTDYHTWYNAKMPIELYPFQVSDSNRGFSQNILDAQDTGLGKTFILGETIRLIYENFKEQEHIAYNRPTIIFTLKTVVKDQVFDALTAYFADKGFSVPVWKDWFGFDTNSPYITVTHHEVARTYFDDVKRIKWLCVGVDEAHKMCNPDNQFTQAIKKLTAYRKIALTGTPFDRNPSKIWSILHWLAPSAYPSATKFDNEHTLYRDGRPIGCKDYKKFAIAIAPYTIRRTKRDPDVFPNLPKKLETVVEVKMLPEQVKVYKQIKAALGDSIIIDEQDEQFSITNVLAQLTRLQQVTSCPSGIQQVIPEDLQAGRDKKVLHPFKSVKVSAKLDWVEGYLQKESDEETNRKILIFTRFTETLEELHKRLVLRGIKHEVIQGGLKDGEAYKRAKVYKTSEDTNVLIGVIEAMGTGLDLPETSVSIFIDCHHSHTKMKQAQDRMRDSADMPKEIIYLITPRTVDRDVYRAFMDKKEIHAYVHQALYRVQEDQEKEQKKLVSL